jgi:hypothetical protein
MSGRFGRPSLPGKFPFPAHSGDWFDDCMVGSQVRALVRPPPSPWVETFVTLLAFIAPEWGLFASACVSAGGLCLAEGPICAIVSASKISVPRSSGDRFGDWVVSASARASGRDFWPRVFASKNFAPGSWALVLVPRMVPKTVSLSHLWNVNVVDGQLISISGGRVGHLALSGIRKLLILLAIERN